MDPSSNESTRDLLDRRERELMEKASSLRDQLEPIEKDLADVRRAKAALGMKSAGYSPLSELLGRRRSRLREVTATEADVAKVLASQTLAGGYNPFERMTIKGLIVKALDEHYRDAAATAQELLDFFRDAWGQEIDRASLSPQLSRLQEEGAIARFGGNKWMLVPEAITEDQLKGWGVIPPWAIAPDRFKRA
jgi:hypothetical protein